MVFRGIDLGIVLIIEIEKIDLVVVILGRAGGKFRGRASSGAEPIDQSFSGL